MIPDSLSFFKHNFQFQPAVCSGSVVVTLMIFRKPGSNPELIYYEASIAQGLPEPYPSGVVHWVPEQLNIKAVMGHAS